MPAWITQKEAQELDIDLMREDFIGFRIDQLMEMAGLGVAEVIDVHLSLLQPKPFKVLVVCGPGNNGGDGMVAARHLSNFGYANTTLLFTRDSVKYSHLARQADAFGVKVLGPDGIPGLEISAFDVVVDCIFGFSFDGAGIIREPYAEIITRMMEAKRQNPDIQIISVDVPSGWVVDDGSGANLMKQVAIQPDVLVSLTLPKRCTERLSENTAHYLVGRFLCPALIEKYNLTDLPAYESRNAFIRL